MSSCRPQNATDEKVAVAFETVKIDSVVGIVLDLNCKGDSLLINQFNGEKFLSWFSLENGKILKTAINRGVGPGEMTGPLKVCMLKDGKIVIYDRQGFQAYRSDFGCESVDSVMHLPFYASNVFCFDDGRILMSKIPLGVDDEEEKNTRFTVFTDSMHKTCFGEYPRMTAEEKENPTDVLAQFHQTRGFCELPGGRFVVVSSHVLSMYGYDGKEYSLLCERSIAPYDYEYSVSGPNQSASVELKEGYSKGATDVFYHSGLIYVPFRENKDENMKVLCYDMNLDHVKTLELEVQFNSPVCLTPEGRMIAIGEMDDTSCIYISKDPIDKIVEN